MTSEREIQRLTEMTIYEQQAYQEGAQYIAGVDEVGRGSLAGPVVACALILPPNCLIEHVNDSKKLTPKRRDELSKIIYEKALDVAIGLVDYPIIDEINILNASNRAMAQAVANLKIKPDCVLVDGYFIKEMRASNQKAIIKGDQKSITIAAASIVAKVYRDRLMCQYHGQYPLYHFDQNKGYGTRAHVEVIRQLGATEIHRKSFLKKIISPETTE